MKASTDQTSEFGRTLRSLRDARGLTRAALARKAEVSEATVTRLELYGAKYGPSVNVVVALAGALDVSPDALLSPESTEAVQ